MKRVTSILAIVLGLVAMSAGTASASPRGSNTAKGFDVSHALFEGRWIDLSRGWGSATACLVYPHRPTECFRTTAALLARPSTLTSPDVSCSSPLKLHEKTNQLGTTIFVFTRGLWINLSTVDFDNMTFVVHRGRLRHRPRRPGERRWIALHAVSLGLVC